GNPTRRSPGPGTGGRVNRRGPGHWGGAFGGGDHFDAEISRMCRLAGGRPMDPLPDALPRCPSEPRCRSYAPAKDGVKGILVRGRAGRGPWARGAYGWAAARPFPRADWSVSPLGPTSTTIRSPSRT